MYGSCPSGYKWVWGRIGDVCKGGYKAKTWGWKCPSGYKAVSGRVGDVCEGSCPSGYKWVWGRMRCM